MRDRRKPHNITKAFQNRAKTMIIKNLTINPQGHLMPTEVRHERLMWKPYNQ